MDSVIPTRKKAETKKDLRRYTDIAALMYLLSERKITLLAPKLWDDFNDSYYLSVYKDKKRLKSVLVLCFTQVKERYHHWKVFAGSSSGVCICFKRSELLRTLKKHEGIKTGEVEYLTLEKREKKTLKITKLPFCKRNAFKDEVEFRVIYESKTKNLDTLDISIPLSCIARITLSPWAHKSMLTPIKKILKSIEGCSKLEIVRSTLINNEKWKNIGASAQ